MLDEFRFYVKQSIQRNEPMPEFPEKQIAERLDNTWHDTGEAVVGNWMGCIYQITDSDRRKPFMNEVDPNDPLGIRL